MVFVYVKCVKVLILDGESLVVYCSCGKDTSTNVTVWANQEQVICIWKSFQKSINMIRETANSNIHILNNLCI